ncbi:hypothetical protein JOC85_003659 [Bacillus mesophilus]|uniref:Lipid II:glycine glycyltransferase n=1 Tax=Bacillus mesophilus TaxID=1808955 RepID=A0A6M0QE14_9BACI|nr:peptidoglycan bridge formation glycyltransferase FemA/FemB family protein [Bacillus mesophilus]MBM7662848.1 hypothetical protein [Bacillus mesophilus]NEY73438.1 aminoacyltransferase [Bacillus mesophilus]
MHYVLSSKNKEKWQKELKDCGVTDLYFELDYCLLYTQLGDGEPYLFVYEQAGEKIVYPFLKRELSSLPFVDKNEKYFDIITPYGYGGPLGSLSKEMVEGFRKAFEEYCKQEKIITEFVRFNPLIQNQVHHETCMEVLHIRDTVYIDLEQNEDHFFKNLHKNHRRNTVKAIKNGLTTRILQGTDAVAEIPTFLELYYQTMDKNNASEYYYFPSNYFHQLFKHFPNNSMITIVYNQETPIAAAIFFYQGEFLHYHLGGSNQDYMYLGANNLLFYQATLWGMKQRFKKLHLGGGYSGDDSLFQYKKRFNSQGILDFYIGKKIHNEEKYNNLITSWKEYYAKKEYNPNFFPVYRQQ